MFHFDNDFIMLFEIRKPTMSDKRKHLGCAPLQHNAQRNFAGVAPETPIKPFRGLTRCCSLGFVIDMKLDGDGWAVVESSRVESNITVYILESTQIGLKNRMELRKESNYFCSTSHICCRAQFILVVFVAEFLPDESCDPNGRNNHSECKIRPDKCMHIDPQRN